MDRDELRDQKLKEFFRKDQVISDKANNVFDSFIQELNKANEKNVIQEIKTEEKVQEIKVEKNTEKEESKPEASEEKVVYFNFRKILTAVASCMIILVGSNVYATKIGYDNIFFLIKEQIQSITVTDKEEIFSDRDIVISYQSFLVTPDVEMQINELYAQNNSAELFLTINELASTDLVPFKYKVYNEKNEVLCNLESAKEVGMTKYKESLKLNKFSDDTNILKMEVYSSSDELLKTISIDLANQTIEAKSESVEVKKISQIKLKQFLTEEVNKVLASGDKSSSSKNTVSNTTVNNVVTNTSSNNVAVTNSSNVSNSVATNTTTVKKELSNTDKEALILNITDIEYYDYRYVVKFIYMTPTKEDYGQKRIESLPIYQNTAKFKLVGDNFELVSLEDGELVDLKK